MKKCLFLLLILFLIPSLIYGAGINISALPDGGSTVDKASVMAGNIGSRTGTTSRFTIAELFGLYFGTLTSSKFCTYNASSGKVDCASSGSFDQTGNYTLTGTIDASGATITWPATITTTTFVGALTGNADTATKLTLADASTITPPAAAATIDGALIIVGTDGVSTWLSSTSGCIVRGTTDGVITCDDADTTWASFQSAVVSGTLTDEQIACWETTDGKNKLKSCGAKVTDNSTASHATYKDSSGYIANQVLTIDAHAASTTITLIPGICPIIHNASQADSNINNTLPAVGAGLCFVALATSAETDKYWRLTAASANTVCLNRTCGKDYIQFDTPAVGDTFTCMSDGTNWYCYDRDSDATVGDL